MNFIHFSAKQLTTARLVKLCMRVKINVTSFIHKVHECERHANIGFDDINIRKRYNILTAPYFQYHQHHSESMRTKLYATFVTNAINLYVFQFLKIVL